MSEDQLQPEDTLDDRGVDDVLDEGISPPEKLRGSTAKSVTSRGQEERETIEERLRQEEPEAIPEDAEDAEDSDEEPLERPEVGDERTGRLAAPDAADGEPIDDTEATDVGIDGGAASAEEAAMHTIDEPPD